MIKQFKLLKQIELNNSINVGDTFEIYDDYVKLDELGKLHYTRFVTHGYIEEVKDTHFGNGMVEPKNDICYLVATQYPASDFIEKERKPKQGEWVFVRDHDNEEREKRIFLCEVPKACNRKYLCVYDVYESDYLEGKDVSWEGRKQIKQLPKEVKSTYTLELTEEQYKKVQDLISK